MNGFLLVDKPKGWTSFDVVNKIRFTLADHLKKSAKQLKVGHSGTLDPMATGLLIILIGEFTKRQSEFMGLDKTYSAKITLGASSDTDDADGIIIQTKGARPINRRQLDQVLMEFKGQQLQVPPQYSAIKKEGKRAYELSRRGQSVELEARSITVVKLTDVEYDWPKVNLRLKVSSGTYIRSLARDLGQKLGVGGYLSGLIRERIGHFSLEDALVMDQLGGEQIEQNLRHS